MRAGVSAKGALLNRSLGHRPRYKADEKIASAESAIHFNTCLLAAVD